MFASLSIDDVSSSSVVIMLLANHVLSPQQDQATQNQAE
jgi:hypothetical protein